MDRDDSAHARLDFENSRVVLPLDAYRPSEDEEHISARARAATISTCMRSKGFAAEDQSDNWDQIGDRRFGLWDVARAKKYGFGGADDGGVTSTPERDKAAMECGTALKAQLDKVSIPDDLRNSGVGAKLENESYTHAMDDPEWKKIRSDWWQCLSDHGLSPRRGDSDWSSKEADAVLAKETTGGVDAKTRSEEIKVATTEAQCNLDTRMAQRLGDLQASYQAPLIKKNEAALNEEKKKIDGYVQNARNYLQTHK